MPHSLHPIAALTGHVVTRWQGTEMALTEGLSPDDIRWEDASVPYLQLTQLEFQLASGQAFRLVSQLEDGTGFHGLHLVELEHLSVLNCSDNPSSIYRDRALSELPAGKIATAELRQDGPNAVVEAKVVISGTELRLLAGEVHEQADGSLLVVEPEESILVQVNRARPNPSIERTVTSGLRPLVTAAHVKR
jgi:hypothetical protein